MSNEVAERAKFAYALREAMKARGVTAEQLGKAIGRERRTIFRWTAGSSAPSVVELGPLARALGVDPRLFIDPPEVPKPPQYPIADFLLPDTQAGLEEGTRRAVRRVREGQ